MTEHVDVLIVGAGLSGIGVAAHLTRALPEKSYVILEGREAIGGTWDLFRYPGVRSDSDMQTLGYRFRPWTDEKALADGTDILSYVQDTADEYGVNAHIRFGHDVAGAEWSSADARWTVRATSDGQPVTFTCGTLVSCAGYYRYDQGFTPEFAGRERFQGQIVHPQFWPEDLDYTDKKVVVIGSGATAITLVPAMTDKAAHVTMLQRTPTYIMSLPARDPIANRLRKLLGDERGYRITRFKNVMLQRQFFKLSQKYPARVRKVIRWLQERQLPKGYDFDTHLTPPYNPWDQRMCVIPDGDLFRALRRGTASIATDRVETFTETGVKLESGAELEADIIVTATGLNMLAFGGLELTVDGEPVKLPETMAYKGMMLSNVPNFVFQVGYTNASWTLKVDLVCHFLCRLLAHMDANGYDAVVPHSDDPTLTGRPLMDGFTPGYVLRSIEQFPQQGNRAPWEVPMDYRKDIKTIGEGRVDDPELRFSRVGDRAALAA